MKKRILILGTSDNGGVSIYVSSLIQRINKYLFVIPKNDDDEVDKLKKLFPNAIFVEMNQDYSWFSFVKTLFVLNQIVKKNQIKFIHAHTLKAGFLATWFKLLFNSKIKIIYTGHGLRYTQKEKYLSKIFFKYAEIFTNKLSNKIVFIRQLDYEIANKEKIVSIHKSFYIRTQINRAFDLTNSIDIRSDFKIKTHFIIANAASIYELKKPELFIEIARLVLERRNDVTFIWLGDGANRNNINEKLKKEHLSDRIKFLGSIEPDLMLNVFSQIDGLLLTSKIETFPLVILEAYFTNAIVFCSNFLGADEIVKNMKTGFIYDMMNPKEACNHIDAVLSDPLKLNKITNQANNYFRTNFNNIELFVKQYIVLYESD